MEQMRFKQIPILGQRQVPVINAQNIHHQVLTPIPNANSMPVEHIIDVQPSPQLAQFDSLRAQVVRSPHLMQQLTPYQVPYTGQCPCASTQKCIDCQNFQDGNDIESQILNELDPSAYADQGSCWCAPRTICPNCFLAKEVKKIHETGFKEAGFDADIQNKLSSQANLEAKLFSESEKFAKEVQEHEKKAQEAAKILQKETQEANNARKMMEHYQQQAKMVAFKSIKTMNQFPLHMNSPNTDIKIQQIGVKTTNVVETQPEFSIEMHANDIFTDDQFLEQHKF